MIKPNVLLVVLDATRKDACSCYGNELETTPALDRLAREGILYKQAISAAPWTLPAVSSIFTGLYPGQTDIYIQRALDSKFETLAQILQQNQYATFAITNNDWLSADFGLQRGFDQVYKLWQFWQSKEDITNLSIIEKESAEDRIAAAALKRALRGNILKNGVNTFYYKFLRYRNDYGAQRTFKPLTRWIKEQDKPWFAFVHLMEGHLQYRPPEAFARRFAHDWLAVSELLKADQWRLCWRHISGVELLSDEQLQAWKDLYLAEVAYADYHLGLIIEWLKDSDILNSTIVIVTADHGEHLGDHGLLNHSYSLFESLIQVPLIVRYPPFSESGKEIDFQVQTIDLFASVLDLANVPIPADVASRSFFSRSYDRSFALAEYGKPIPPHPEPLKRFGLEVSDVTPRQRGLAALRTVSHKLIVGTDGTEALYDLQNDPEESINLAEQEPARAKEMRGVLKKYWADHGIDGLIGAPTSPMAVDADVEQRLQDLGYLE